MRPTRLFPRIPYTRQKGRMGLVGPDHPPFTRYELARIQKMLLAGLDRACCPRCGKSFDEVARRPQGSASREVWVVNCHPCGRGAVIPVHRDPEPTGDLFQTLVHSRPTRAERASWWLARTSGVALVWLGLVAAALSADRGLVEVAEAASIPETLYVVVARPSAPAAMPVLRIPPAPAAPPGAVLPAELLDTLTPTVRAGSSPATAAPQPVSGASLRGLVQRFPVREAEPAASTTRIYSFDTVDEPPVLIAAGALRYPRALRARRQSGSVVVEFVVDSTGNAERESIRIVSSDHDGFNGAAEQAVLDSVYAPGRAGGRPVRVLVTLTLHFAVADRP